MLLNLSFSQKLCLVQQSAQSGTEHASGLASMLETESWQASRASALFHTDNSRSVHCGSFVPQQAEQGFSLTTLRPQIALTLTSDPAICRPKPSDLFTAVTSTTLSASIPIH